MSCNTCLKADIELIGCCNVKIEGKGIYKIDSTSFNALGATIHTNGGDFVIGNLTNIDGVNYPPSEIEGVLCEYMTNCCAPSEVEPVEPEIEVGGISHLTLCKDNAKVVFEVCKLEDKTTTYTGSDGSSFTDYAAIFADGYSVDCVEGKKFIDTQWYTDNNENVPDCDKTPVAIDRYFDGTEWCYEFTGNALGTDNLNINNYKMLGDFSLGNVKINDPVCVCALVQYNAPVGSGAITKTRAEILADVVAKLGITAPAGTAWDLQTAKIAVYSKGTDVTDFTSQAEETTAINADADVTCGGTATTINVNGGQIPFGNDPLDMDCNGESDNLLPADFAVDFEEQSAVAIYACVTPVTV